jgi:AcrR family transcriptional regulator
MARPKYAPDDIRALDKLESAFWDMLAEMSYPRISVRALVAQCGLNKNTFYYHFTDMDELATYCIDRALPIELGNLAFAGSSVEDFTRALDSPVVRDKLSRTVILLSENGSALHALAVQRLVRAWQVILPPAPDIATEEQALQLKFAAGGLVATLAGREMTDYAKTIAHLRKSPAVIVFVDSIGNEYRE